MDDVLFTIQSSTMYIITVLFFSDPYKSCLWTKRIITDLHVYGLSTYDSRLTSFGTTVISLFDSWCLRVKIFLIFIERNFQGMTESTLQINKGTKILLCNKYFPVLQYLLKKNRMVKNVVLFREVHLIIFYEDQVYQGRTPFITENSYPVLPRMSFEV